MSDKMEVFIERFMVGLLWVAGGLMISMFVIDAGWFSDEVSVILGIALTPVVVLVVYAMGWSVYLVGDFVGDA